MQSRIKFVERAWCRGGAQTRRILGSLWFPKLISNLLLWVFFIPWTCIPWKKKFVSILSYGFFYHIVFVLLTFDYGWHSCKVYVSLAKEKSLNCICYFLVLLLKLLTSNLQAWNIIWFLKLKNMQNNWCFFISFPTNLCSGVWNLWNIIH